MLDSNAKAIIKNVVSQNSGTISAVGLSPSGGINVQGYNTFYFYINGTFSTSAININLRMMGSTIQTAAVRVYNAVTAVEVPAITVSGFYFVIVKGYDLLYFNTTTYGGSSLTVQWTLTNAEGSLLSKLDSFYENKTSAYSAFTSTGYSNSIKMMGVNTAIIHFQRVSGTCNVAVEKRDNAGYIQDRNATIYDLNMQPIPAITDTGFYFVDVKGCELLYLYANTNTGTINANVKTSLVSIDNPFAINRITVFNAVSANGYSSLILKNAKQKYIKLDIRRNSCDGTFNLIGRYSDSTNRKVTIFSQNGRAVTDCNSDGIYYAEVSLWTSLFGYLASNTTGTITVYAELLENITLPILQPIDSLFEKVSLECSPKFYYYEFAKYYNSFVIHNKSKYCPALIKFTQSSDSTKLTNPVRVEPGERMTIQSYNKNAVYYATVAGHADVEVYAGDINMSPIPPAGSSVQIDALSGRTVLDIKGSWCVFADVVNPLKIYFSYNSGTTDFKNYTFSEGSGIGIAFITKARSVIVELVDSTNNVVKWYRLVNCFNDDAIVCTAIDSLNNPVDGNGIIAGWYSSMNSIDQYGGSYIVFGEYIPINDNNNNNMRLLKSNDDGVTWTIALNMVRGYLSDTHTGVHHQIASVNTTNKQLVVPGDITSLCSVGQTGFVVDTGTGILLKITNLAYDSGTGQTTITTLQAVNTVWVGKYFSGIRHFHTVKYSLYDNKWYITCGDEDYEAIWFTYDDTINTPLLIKQTGNSQSWRTITMGFDGNGNIYHCCDGHNGMMGVIKTNTIDFSSINIFPAKSYIYCFDLNNNIMIVATTPTAYVKEPANIQSMHDCSEIYISYDMGTTWKKIFHWKAVANTPGGFVRMWGKDSKGRYYFRGENLLNLDSSAEDIITVVITI